MSSGIRGSGQAALSRRNKRPQKNEKSSENQVIKILRPLTTWFLSQLTLLFVHLAQNVADGGVFEAT